MSSRILMALLPLTWAAPLHAQAVPTDLNDFGLICFCNSRIATPHYVIPFDNNGQLLFAARSGATRDQLRSQGVAVTQSQVRMLKDWGLLAEKNKVLKTDFPVLEPARMAALRAGLATIAAQILPRIEPDARAIQAELRKRGQAESTYAVLFSYVLDGLVWGQLQSSGNLPNMDINAEHPFWAGTFWAVYPKQDDMPGTNGSRRGDASLKFMWSKPVVDDINRLANSDASKTWQDQLNKRSASLSALFGDPRLQPVIVREGEHDPIYLHGTRIAEAIAPPLASADLSQLLPEANESQRLLIATHEVIWMLLADLVKAERLRVPAVLATGSKSPSDLWPLVVGVLHAPGPVASKP